MCRIVPRWATLIVKIVRRSNLFDVLTQLFNLWVEGSIHNTRGPVHRVPALARKLHRSRFALISVPRSFTAVLVSEFDAFMSTTLKTFDRLQPDALNASERTMTSSNSQPLAR
jgi:hypothetical protein